MPSQARIISSGGKCLKLPTLDQTRPFDSTDSKRSQMVMASSDLIAPNGGHHINTNFCQQSFPAQPPYTLGLAPYGQDPFAHMGSFSHPFSITNLIDPINNKSADFCQMYSTQSAGAAGYPAMAQIGTSVAPSAETACYYHTLYSSNNPSSASSL